ncbi:MAG: phosphoadenylyl-sulfate reductase [Myxococcales bacterium]
MTPEEVALHAKTLEHASPEAILTWALSTFAQGNLAQASSLAAEDQVVTHLLAGIDPRPAIFTLDTGRLFPELYATIARTEERYGLRIEVLFPDRADVENLVREEGINCFRRSVVLRKRCCDVRKVRLLHRRLAGLQAWITGLRREQSVTRIGVRPVEWDTANGLVKINPLAAWSEAQVWAFVAAHEVPYCELQDRGYSSLGCAPCTRAIEPGEDARAGRWWWEEPEHKECGLHLVDGTPVRARLAGG